MSRLGIRRPTPALVVSMIALIVALGGTSYAAFSVPNNSVGTSQLKNGSVGTLKLKNGAVTTAKLKNGAVTAAKLNVNGVTVPNALHANAADTATTATNATNATHATTADTATLANSLPALTWASLTLLNSWANYSSSLFGRPGLQYTKDAEGFVHLRGTVTGTAATSTVIATLPAGFRPPSGAWVSIAETNGASDPHPEAVWIDSTGNMNVYPGAGGTNSFVSFEGAEFSTSP